MVVMKAPTLNSPSTLNRLRKSCGFFCARTSSGQWAPSSGTSGEGAELQKKEVQNGTFFGGPCNADPL